MRILLNADNAGSRKEVDAELVRENAKSVWVRLSDGNIIKRKKTRDVPKEGSNEPGEKGRPVQTPPTAVV